MTSHTVQRLVDRYARWVLGDICPDPERHQQWHEDHDETRRRRAAGTPIEVVPGVCPYCGGRRP